MKIQKFTITYSFNVLKKQGVSNSITVEALNREQAIEKAKKEVAMAYGSGMVKKFTFK